MKFFSETEGTTMDSFWIPPNRTDSDSTDLSDFSQAHYGYTTSGASDELRIASHNCPPLPFDQAAFTLKEPLFDAYEDLVLFSSTDAPTAVQNLSSVTSSFSAQAFEYELEAATSQLPLKDFDNSQFPLEELTTLHELPLEEFDIDDLDVYLHQDEVA